MLACCVLHDDHIKKARLAKINVATFKPTYAADPVYDPDEDEDEDAADELLDVALAVLLDLVVVEVEDSELDPSRLEVLVLLLDMFPLALALV